MKIRIERLMDEHNCDDCGYSYAEGATIFIDDEFAFELTPFAHCFNDESYDDSKIFKAILEYFGHELNENS